MISKVQIFYEIFKASVDEGQMQNLVISHESFTIIINIERSLTGSATE